MKSRSVSDAKLAAECIAEGVAGSFTAKAVPAHGVLAVALAPTA